MTRSFRFAPCTAISSLLVLLLTGCATTRLPPISHQGAAFRPLPDEVDLWAETRSEEQEILQSFPVYRDRGLDQYLQGLVNRLAPAGLLANRELDLRVIVLDDPSPYAFTFPHGTILLHAGLLARLENEDQLAAVLAREISHVENRHLARHLRAQENRKNGLAALTLTTAILLDLSADEEFEEGDWEDGEVLTDLSDDVAFVGFEMVERVKAEGYGRMLEQEADAGAVRLLRARGYDARQALAFYEALREDGGDSNELVYCFFVFHPSLDKTIIPANAWKAEHTGVSVYDD